MVLYYLPSSFIKLFRCNPIRKTWEFKSEGRCITSEYNIILVDCIFSIVIDIGILLLPIPLVWKLHTSTKRKLRVLSVFVGGAAYVTPVHASSKYALTYYVVPVGRLLRVSWKLVT